MKKRLIISMLLIFAGGIAGNTLRYTERAPARTAEFSVIPLQIDGFVGQEYPLGASTEEILKADLTTHRVYRAPDGTEFQLFIAYFKSQKYGSQIHSPKHCLPGGGWRIDQLHPYRLELPGAGVKIVNRGIIGNGDLRAFMFYWFETRSGAIRNEYGLKLDLVKNALLFRPTDAAIIRLVIIPSTGRQDTFKKGVEFLDVFYPSIEKSLPF